MIREGINEDGAEDGYAVGERSVRSTAILPIRCRGDYAEYDDDCFKEMSDARLSVNIGEYELRVAYFRRRRRHIQEASFDRQ